MKYFFDVGDAERDSDYLPPLTRYMTYPEEYTGPIPKMADVDMGYGKLTSGLLTVAGGGRSFGVLGEGNAHSKVGAKKGDKIIDVDEMGMRLRKEVKTYFGCDNSYLMLSLVPIVDSASGADKLAIQVSSKEWMSSLAPPAQPVHADSMFALRQKSVIGMLVVFCGMALVQ